MIKLENNGDLWSAFAGACSFADGTDPLFAEIDVSSCPVTIDPDAPGFVLVLDEQRSGFVGRDTVLTVNGMRAEGYPIVYRKAIPARFADRRAMQTWAEKNLSPSMSHAGLLMAGFEYDPEY